MPFSIKWIYLIERSLDQKYKFSNKNDMVCCAWRNFQKYSCGISTYDKWNFKPQISSIFHFDWVSDSRVAQAHVLGVKLVLICTFLWFMITVIHELCFACLVFYFIFLFSVPKVSLIWSRGFGKTYWRKLWIRFQSGHFVMWPPSNSWSISSKLPVQFLLGPLHSIHIRASDWTKKLKLRTMYTYL